VNQHVDAAECLDGLIDEPFAVLRVGDIGGQSAGIAAPRAAFLRERLEPLAIARREREARAAARELERQRAADAFGSTGQDDPSSLHEAPPAESATLPA
jgi:hypothetical protein